MQRLTEYVYDDGHGYHGKVLNRKVFRAVLNATVD